MSEELDLTGSKWIQENEIYIVSILESFKENYPKADIEKEMNSLEIKNDDLIDPIILKKFIAHLQNNFPEQ